MALNRYAPIEAKVTAATAAAAVVTLVLYTLSFVPLVAAMPDYVYGAVVVLVTGAVTFAAGWVARHTPRPGDGDPPPTASAPLTGDRATDYPGSPYDDGRALRGYQEPHGRLAG